MLIIIIIINFIDSNPVYCTFILELHIHFLLLVTVGIPKRCRKKHPIADQLDCYPFLEVGHVISLGIIIITIIYSIHTVFGSIMYCLTHLLNVV